MAWRKGKTMSQNKIDKSISNQDERIESLENLVEDLHGEIFNLQSLVLQMAGALPVKLDKVAVKELIEQNQEDWAENTVMVAESMGFSPDEFEGEYHVTPEPECC